MGGTLIIGIGGSGCCVANWSNRTLVERYGSREKAGVSILALDGPRKDQYAFPGEVQIDTSDGSKESYRLETTPSGVIKAVAEGKKVLFISGWLSQQDARRIPNQSSMNPRAGGGGSRTIGRATFFVNVGGIYWALNEHLDEAIGYLPGTADGTDDNSGDGGQALVFVNMSTAGSIGSGMGLDVAHLLKSIKNENAMTIGMVTLPNAYNAIISDPAGIIKLDAKSTAFLRELVRFQHADEFPARIEYTHDIGIVNGQLFDLCIIIDGEGTYLSLNDVHPTYGVCAAAADLEMAFVLDDRHIASDLSNRATSVIGSAGEGRRFITFGIHSYIFSRADVLEIFSHRFAHDLYGMLLTPPEGAEEEGPQLADELLNHCSFTRLAQKLQANEELPLKPPVDEQNRRQLSKLIDGFTVDSGGSSKFPLATPDEKLLQLSRKVKTSQFWFFSVHNQKIINGCRPLANSYMGTTEDKPNGNTVRGWLNRQREHIEEELSNMLARQLKGIFYHPRTNEPISLNEKPYVLVVAKDYLQYLRKVMELLESEFKDAYTRWVDDEGVLEKQRTKVEELGKNLSQSGKNRQLQKEYICEYQRLMELEIWAVLIKACADLAARLRAIIERWWIQIGHPTQSFYSFIQDIVADLDSQISSILSVRTDIAKVKVRRYFPYPDDPAEKAMYADLVEAKEYHTEILSRMNFEFHSEERNKLDETSQQDGVYDLYLNIPDVDGYKTRTNEQSRYDAATGKYKNLMVEEHSAEKIVQYGRNCLEQPMKDMGLWEAMLYDYKHCWRPLKDDDQVGMEEYVMEMASAMSEKSHVFLSQRPSGQGEARDPVLKKFCLGSFRSLPNAAPGSVDELVTLFKERMDGGAGKHQVDAMDDMVMCLQLLLGVNIRNWAYFPTSQSNYDLYLKDPESEPIQIHPQERNALELEFVLRDERLLDGGYLPASTVKYLGDMEAFTSFSMVYALDLLEVKSNGMGKEDEYMVRVETAGSGQSEVILGTCNDLNMVIATYLAPGKADVRARVTEKLGAHLTNRESQVGIEGIITELRSAAESVRATDNAGQHDLHLAIIATIYGFIRTVSGNQRHSTPQALPGEPTDG